MPAPLRFAVRVRPGASRAAVGGCRDGARGPALVVAVTEPPVDGRANDAMLRALAAALGVPRSDLRVLSGVRGRDKLVGLDRPPADAQDRLAALLDGSSPR